MRICIFCSYSAYSHILLIFCIFWSSSSSYLDRNISDAGRASMPKIGIGAKISFSWYIHLDNVLSFCFSRSLRLSMVACMSRWKGKRRKTPDCLVLTKISTNILRVFFIKRNFVTINILRYFNCCSNGHFTCKTLLYREKDSCLGRSHCCPTR